MKQRLLKRISLALLMVVGASSAWADNTVTWSSDKSSVTITPSVDGWIRETETSSQNYTGTDYEIKHTRFTKITVETTQDFQAVLKFAIPAARPGKVISSVSLKLVTKKSAARTSMAIYQLGTDIASGNTYATLSDAITAAKEAGTIGTFTIAHQVRSQQIGTDNIGNYDFDLAAWTNNVTLSTTNITAGSNLNLFVTIASDQAYDGSENSVNKFFSSRAENITVTTSSGTTDVVAANLIPVLTVTYTNNPLAEFISPSADRTCRTQAANENGADATIEIQNNSTFVGLMAFTMPNKKGYEVESATLKLVFERVRGGSGMEIYPYTTAFSESGRTGHSSESDATRIATEAAIAKAKTAGTITTFTANGTSKALTSSNDGDKVTGDYTDIDSWTNNIDLTDYVKNFTSGSSVGLMIAVSTATGANKIFSKEATKSTVTNTGMTVVADELVKPQLIIVYKKMDSYKLPVTSAGAATLCLPFDATIPTDGNLKAYTLSYSSGDNITATPVTGGTLTANTPVLITANENASGYEFTRTGEITDGTPTSEVLTGVYTETNVAVNDYILTNHSGSVAFRKVNKADTNKVGAYRAYMSVAYVPSGSGSSIQAPALFTISFPGVDGTTDIKAVDRPIVDDGVIYNLQGVRMNSDNLPKGIYIKNGKKFVVK